MVASACIRDWIQDALSLVQTRASIPRLWVFVGVGGVCWTLFAKLRVNVSRDTRASVQQYGRLRAPR